MSKPTSYRNVAGFRCLLNIEKQTSDLYLVHCGQQQCTPGYTYNHKIPNEYHLHFVLNGKGTLKVSQRIYHIKKDDIFLIPKDAHIHYYADMENPWEYMWITFDGEKSVSYLQHAGLSEDNPVIQSTIPNNAYQPMIQKILDANELTFANEIKRVGYLYEILSTLIEVQSSLKAKQNKYDYPSNTYVDYAIQFVKHNYNHIRVQDIAEYIGINRSYLTSIFKKQLGISPQEYLVSFRLKKSAELLINTNLSISEISNSIGYENPLTFSKIFKQTYGMCPKIYRENNL
ncbi:MAG: helix-turn-helix domain-containing protein [Candidatus Galacturonibacter soehngenii]|nr:helix-turn-helix domain-containing protein [Candidatus Galacturonibacter soehngenii]